MNALDIVATAAGLAVWFVVLIALLRWPGRTIGFSLALMAWTVVGPWAFWAALGLTFLGAMARRRCETHRRTDRRRARRGRPPLLAPLESPAAAGELVPATKTERSVR